MQAAPQPVDKIDQLVTAASNGVVETVVRLLAEGVDVNSQDKRGTTPLIAAAWFNKPEVVKVLIAAKARLDQTDYNGDAPLHWATVNGGTESIQLLVAAGADWKKTGSDGHAPLEGSRNLGRPHITEIFQALKDKDDLARATAEELAQRSQAAHIAAEIMGLQHGASRPVSIRSPISFRR